MHECNQHRSTKSQYDKSDDATVDEAMSLNEERIKELIHIEYQYYLRPRRMSDEK